MITMIIYMIFLLGVVLTQMPLIRAIYMGIKNRIRYGRNLRAITEDNRRYGPILSHIKTLEEATRMNRIFGSPEIFTVMSICIFTGAFFIMYWVGGMAFSLAIGAFCGLMPYIFMRIKLNNSRVRSSREGDIMVQELLNNYKINDYNMKEAIEKTAASLDDAPDSKLLLYDMAKGFNKAYTGEDIRRVLNMFRYSLNTSWGNALATTIYFSQVHGIKVVESLEDISDSLVKSRKVVEHGRRENSEASMMLKYLAPVSYLLSVLCACRYFGFSLGKFIEYQFGTSLGLRWFIITGALFIMGLILNSYLAKEKMDI